MRDSNHHFYLALLQFLACTDGGSIPDTLVRGDALYAQVGRDFHVLVASNVTHHGTNIVDGLPRRIEDFEPHRALLATGEHTVALGLCDDGVAYLQR